MKIIEFTDLNYYSCQGCGNHFRLLELVKIIPGLKPVCSSKCKFKAVYNILASYDIETLRTLWKEGLCPDFKEDFDKNTFVYALTKIMTDILYTKEWTSGQATRKVDKSTCQQQGSGQVDKTTAPYEVGGCPHPCLQVTFDKKYNREKFKQ